MTSADVSFAVDGLTVGAADLGGEPEFRFAMGTVLHDADLGEQLTRTASGTVATAATAYAGAALRSVAVKGRSVQDGTPTPDAPVAIDSIDSLTLMVGRGDQSDPTAAPLDLDGHALRSLPDGTCDEAVWTADGGTLTQRLHVWNMRDYANSDWRKSGSASNGFYIQISNLTTAAVKQAKGNLRCSAATAVDTASAYYKTTNSCFVDNSFNFNLDPAVVGSTVAEFKAWLADHDLWVVAEMAEPTTAELPTSLLPDAPAADMAVWAECEPSTEVDAEYRESIQLAVDEIREAIASIV